MRPGRAQVSGGSSWHVAEPLHPDQVLQGARYHTAPGGPHQKPLRTSGKGWPNPAEILCSFPTPVNHTDRSKPLLLPTATACWRWARRRRCIMVSFRASTVQLVLPGMPDFGSQLPGGHSASAEQEGGLNRRALSQTSVCRGSGDFGASPRRRSARPLRAGSANTSHGAGESLSFQSRFICHSL